VLARTSNRLHANQFLKLKTIFFINDVASQYNVCIALYVLRRASTKWRHRRKRAVMVARPVIVTQCPFSMHAAFLITHACIGHVRVLTVLH
jgi:hypothetical protein